MYYLNTTCHYRIDENFLIKITDFGLSEDIFERNYFRQGSDDEVVKLPVKWMAPESLSDGQFSEKSDVVKLFLTSPASLRFVVAFCMQLTPILIRSHEEKKHAISTFMSLYRTQVNTTVGQLNT